MLISWITENYIEIFGAIAGILYVFLEIRQNLWLWPVGIATSAAYIVIFFTSRLYADMGLQCYYLVISIIGWYWWVKGRGQRAEGEWHRAEGRGQDGQDQVPGELPSLEGSGVGLYGEGQRAQGSGRASEGSGELPSLEGSGVGFKEIKLTVTHLKFKTGLILTVVWIILYILMYQVLKRFTDSPVPHWDSLIASLSVVATWMLARKIFEHWYLWVVVNCIASFLFFSRGLYPTMVLYILYCIMSFEGLREWKKSLGGL